MQNYNTIIGVIQMRQDNCPSRSIMERYRIGSGTVSLIINRYASSGLSLQQLQQMSPKDVENTFYPQKNLQRRRRFHSRIFRLIMTGSMPQTAG